MILTVEKPGRWVHVVLPGFEAKVVGEMLAGQLHAQSVAVHPEIVPLPVLTHWRRPPGQSRWRRLRR
jgi:hypothetical protein